MTLIDLTSENIYKILEEYNSEGGNDLADSLKKLFFTFNNEENINEVSIKVSALNQLYSTAIQYINPVVDIIVKKINNNHICYTLEQYVDLVDAISVASWTQEGTDKQMRRNNLSFCSKYMHFISKNELPIYDGYIWTLLIGYLNICRKNEVLLKFAPPKNYKEFYRLFNQFKKNYNLQKYSNYQLDKFLWQYGKKLVTQIMNENNVTLPQAKSELQKRITKTWCGIATQPHK